MRELPHDFCPTIAEQVYSLESALVVGHFPETVDALLPDCLFLGVNHSHTQGIDTSCHVTPSTLRKSAFYRRTRIVTQYVFRLLSAVNRLALHCIL